MCKIGKNLSKRKIKTNISGFFDKYIRRAKKVTVCSVSNQKQVGEG